MPDEQYKEPARCKYHSDCGFYNQGVLPREIEKRMCGRGQRVDESYKPWIPEIENFTPCEGYAFGPEVVCDAFLYFENSKLIRTMSRGLKAILQRVEEQGYE